MIPLLLSLLRNICCSWKWKKNWFTNHTRGFHTTFKVKTTTILSPAPLCSLCSISSSHIFSLPPFISSRLFRSTPIDQYCSRSLSLPAVRLLVSSKLCGRGLNFTTWTTWIRNESKKVSDGKEMAGNISTRRMKYKNINNDKNKT